MYKFLILSLAVTAVSAISSRNSVYRNLFNNLNINNVVSTDVLPVSLLKRSLPAYNIPNNYYNPYEYSGVKYRNIRFVPVLSGFNPFFPINQFPFGVQPGFVNQFQTLPIATLDSTVTTNQNSDQIANIIGSKNDVEQNSEQISKDTVSQNVN